VPWSSPGARPTWARRELNTIMFFPDVVVHVRFRRPQGISAEDFGSGRCNDKRTRACIQQFPRRFPGDQRTRHPILRHRSRLRLVERLLITPRLSLQSQIDPDSAGPTMHTTSAAPTQTSQASRHPQVDPDSLRTPVSLAVASLPRRRFPVRCRSRRSRCSNLRPTGKNNECGSTGSGRRGGRGGSWG
jgi:hypothetical protein